MSSSVRNAADAAVAAAQEHDPTPRVADAAQSNPRIALALRASAIVSWLLLVVTAIMYCFAVPADRHRGLNSTIWGMNSLHHTPFALNSVLTIIYVDVGFILQLVFVAMLFSSNTSRSGPALRLAPYFTLANLFFFAQIELWVRSLLWPALLFAVLNLLMLLFAYLTTPFASSSLPLPAHAGGLAMPLAMAFVSVYWVGAAAVDAHTLPARIIANIFIWGWAAFGGFFLLAFRDWVLGLSMSVLTAALGVGQFLTHVVALQWIFAFTIMGLLFLASVGVAVKDPHGPTGGSAPALAAPEDREREPLLGRD